jgi:2-polyprenyl-3-methyl-5-hydroxy-6-metoxy-1,4-benzoquinol methylase
MCNDWTTEEVDRIKEMERTKRDLEAEEYVSMVETIYGPFRSAAYTCTLKHYLDLREGEVWLDAGSGVGRMSMEIAPTIKELFCLDHSAASLDVLMDEAKRRGLDNIRIRQGDLCCLGGEDHLFDGVICNEVIQHIPSKDERLLALRNLHQALKPGGKCLINVIRWKGGEEEQKEGYWGENKELYRYYFTPEELVAAMKEAGFTKVTVRGLDMLPYKISKALPVAFAFIDTWCSMLTNSVNFGNNILAIGIK